jgi:hypothetical protein
VPRPAGEEWYWCFRHSDVERHGVHKGVARGDAAGQHAVVAVLIVGQRVPHNLARSLLEELDAVGMCGQDGAVAGEREADGLVSEFIELAVNMPEQLPQPGRRSAQLLHLLVAHFGVGAFDHGCDEVSVLAAPAPGLHRPLRANTVGMFRRNGWP